ncbi:phage shock protein operon transcriptional activator [Kordiimonas marina]|uniref:phage shock protein operon transcriptional activator n=1 Tax=Kordiimonas marina TaxID=2872312 RepID=UPI001FF669ED|nr:phage shock protein operon transcriptional activator [Kordiimonas marina]MCJ9428282.1 phage shock protein operon transcriptional activator [Kordiimonas marina]
MARTNDQILGSSPALLDMMDQISRAAPLDRPMLVIGERGTGKELIAARLHYLSNRWNQPFQKMNCAALAETLLESELFGYEPGAFTGARGRRAGRFEAADTGSLFLDEIGTMSMAAQEKLLRVIEYGEFERVGGNETISVDVRVIGATNIDLPAAAERGTFRHDLLDRLAFDVITVPPLRERPEDIPVLANHFGRAMARELEWLQFPGFSDDALQAMLAYHWPGNVRELKNVVERALYCAWDGEEPVSHIVFDPFESPFRPKAAIKPVKEESAATGTPAPVTPALPTEPFDLRNDAAAYEKKLYETALEACRFNQRAAAGYTGLSYDQFRHGLRKHGLL